MKGFEFRAVFFDRGNSIASMRDPWPITAGSREKKSIAVFARRSDPDVSLQPIHTGGRLFSSTIPFSRMIGGLHAVMRCKPQCGQEWVPRLILERKGRSTYCAARRHEHAVTGRWRLCDFVPCLGEKKDVRAIGTAEIAGRAG